MSATPQNVMPTIAEWKTPEHPKANEYIPISIQISDESNKPIKTFETVHTKKMHMIIVSKDLSYFSHIHPKYEGNGKFTITTSFPAAGDYQIITDFLPKGGGDSSVQKHWIHIEGDEESPKPIVPDSSLTKVIDGIEVTLAFDQLKAGKTLNMTFTLQDEKTKKPIKNLQTYLGAMGHTVALSADGKNYLHIHPMTTKGYGPKVTFMTIFPEKGVYKIWGQFKYQNKIIVVPFVVEVP